MHVGAGDVRRVAMRQLPHRMRSAAWKHWRARLRVEPRQHGGMAHRAVAPSMAPTRERRPSMACLRRAGN